MDQLHLIRKVCQAVCLLQGGEKCLVEQHGVHIAAQQCGGQLHRGVQLLFLHHAHGILHVLQGPQSVVPIRLCGDAQQIAAHVLQLLGRVICADIYAHVDALLPLLGDVAERTGHLSHGHHGHEHGRRQQKGDDAAHGLAHVHLSLAQLQPDVQAVEQRQAAGDGPHDALVQQARGKQHDHQHNAGHCHQAHAGQAEDLLPVYSLIVFFAHF